RQKDDPTAFQVYFTGCAGNITAGKYNDGAKENRPILRDRIHAAMTAAWQAIKRHPIKGWEWRVQPVKRAPRPEESVGEEESRHVLENENESKARRGNAAYQLAWLKRIDGPIEFTCLDFGVAQVLHLPGEPFIEYQLKAQALRKDSFVCVAGYGDDGPGYIPTNKAFLEGGYEPTVALAAPSEPLMTRTLARLLDAKAE